MNTIKEQSDLSKFSYAQIKDEHEKKRADQSVLVNLINLRLPEIPLTIDLKTTIDTIMEEFLKDPSQYTAGGNVNAFAIFQKLYKSVVTFKSMRDFCIIYIASGKNFSKMLTKGSKTSQRHKTIKTLVKNLNIKTLDNTTGYQPEALAGALSPFMCMIRQVIASNNLLPSIDQVVETDSTGSLDARFRWVGSLISLPMPTSVAAIAKLLTDYDTFVQKYIERRAKEGVVKDVKTTKKNEDRRAVNRSFYNTVIAVFDNATKMAWSSSMFAIPVAGAKFAKKEAEAISLITGWDMYRAEDFK